MLQYPTPPCKKENLLFSGFADFRYGRFFFCISAWRINFKSIVKDLAITEPEHSLFFKKIPNQFIVLSPSRSYRCIATGNGAKD